jgi:hypothetical protein
MTDCICDPLITVMLPNITVVHPVIRFVLAMVIEKCEPSK